jgi:hypothetical protein
VDLAAERTVVFEWMRAVQQGAIPRAEMKKELSHVLEFDKLLRGTREGPLAQRKKAMTVLSHEKGVGCGKRIRPEGKAQGEAGSERGVISTASIHRDFDDIAVDD